MTLRIDPHPQWLAAAWLRETGEHHPAIDILRSEKPLTPELRKELANWIAKGSKTRKRSKITRDPWRAYPPKLAKSLHIATTLKEERAWMLLVAFPSTGAGLLALSAPKTGKGRPLTLEGAAAAYVAKKLGIHKRTASAWCARFFPNGLG